MKMKYGWFGYGQKIKTVEVKSIEEAREIVLADLDKMERDGFDYRDYKGNIIYDGKKKVASISTNGRVIKPQNALGR